MDSNYPFNIVDENRFEVDDLILEEIRKEKSRWFKPFKTPYNKPLEKFKDIHVGKDGVMINPGPSLKYFDFEEFKKISDDYVAYGHKAVSYSDKIMKELTYYQFGDGFVEHPERFYKVYAKYPELQSFASAYGCGQYKNRFDTVTIAEVKRMNTIPIDTGNLHRFEMNIALYPMVNHFSGLCACQFLLYTGVRKIYLVGTDATVALDDDKCGGYTSAFATQNSNFSEPIAGYFFTKESSNVPEPHYLHWWIDFKEFVLEEYPEVEIITINPVGLRGIFRDLYLSDPALVLGEQTVG